MRRIYRKMRVALLSFCVLTAVLSTGCSAEETGQSEISEEVYQLGNQEIQIDLSDRFECTKQSAREIVLDGKVGEIKMEYLGEGISSEVFQNQSRNVRRFMKMLLAAHPIRSKNFSPMIMRDFTMRQSVMILRMRSAT